MTAAFASLLFWNVSQSKSGVQNTQGALFFITMNISFNAIQNVILIFPDERPVFLREVNNNMYRCSPYFWAKIISELPFSIITPSLFGCIVYYSVGLAPDFINFLRFLVILVLAYNASSGYSLIISASFSDKQLAVTLTPVLIIPFMLFAGFFVATANIPIWMREFEYLSIFKYAYTALLHNQFDAFCPYDLTGKNYNATQYGQIADPSVYIPNYSMQNGAYNYSCCWESQSLPNSCQPFSQVGDSWPDGDWSIAMLAAIYVGCYLIAWGILIKLSSTYE
jgi:hypothetical protein